MATHPADVTTLVVSEVEGLSTYTTATEQVAVAPPKPPARHVGPPQGRKPASNAVEDGHHRAGVPGKGQHS